MEHIKRNTKSKDLCDAYFDRIELSALGEKIDVLTPKVDFLPMDSVWRLRNIYEPALAAQTMAQAGIAVDVGAGFGAFALPFALAYPGWRVFCFEPDPIAFECLQMNIRSLALTNAIALPFAIGTQKKDALQEPEAVRKALSGLISGNEDAVHQLTGRLPLVWYSKSKINGGYMERGCNLGEEFEHVQVPTLAAQFLEILSPRLLKLIAPKAEADILMDMSDSEIDHVIGESWGHVPSFLIHSPAKGLRQTWLPRAGQPTSALRRSAGADGRFSRLDIVIALPNKAAIDLDFMTTVLNDFACDLGFLIVVDDESIWAESALVASWLQDFRVQVFRTSCLSTGAAWNFGRQQSNATHIAFIDEGCFPAPQFFSGLFELARQTGAEIVQGPYTKFNNKDKIGIARDVSPSLPDEHSAPQAGLSFSEKSYRMVPSSRLLAETPSICHRVYRRDFLDNRGLWIPDHIGALGEYVFQSSCLSFLDDVAELDAPCFVRHFSVESATDLSFYLIEAFRLLLNRGIAEGWKEVSSFVMYFIDNLPTQLSLEESEVFFKSATLLWGCARRFLNHKLHSEKCVDLKVPKNFLDFYKNNEVRCDDFDDESALALLNTPISKEYFNFVRTDPSV